MDYKEELIRFIEIKDEFNIFKGDIRTFAFVLLDKDKSGKSYLERNSLGAGNLTIALICVTQFDLFGQIYKILRFNLDKKCWKNINKTEAFLELSYDFFKYWNYDSSLIRKFWSDLRHSIVHKSFPRSSISIDSIYELKNITEIDSFIESKIDEKPIYYDTTLEGFQIDSILLYVQIIKAKKILIEKIKNDEFEINAIKKVLEFIKN